MDEPESTFNDILVYARVHNPDAKARLRQLFDDLPGERIDPLLYEVYTADWDEGLWEEDVERMRDIIDPIADTLIFWQVANDKLVRTCMSGRCA